MVLSRRFSLSLLSRRRIYSGFLPVRCLLCSRSRTCRQTTARSAVCNGCRSHWMKRRSSFLSGLTAVSPIWALAVDHTEVMASAVLAQGDLLREPHYGWDLQIDEIIQWGLEDFGWRL